MAKNYFCPICGKDLHKINNIDSVCLEQTCKIWGRPIPNVVSDYLRDMVGALIVSQTDLEIARRALKEYADRDMWETCHRWDVDYEKAMFMEHGYKIAEIALKQTDHIADASKMAEQKETQ